MDRHLGVWGCGLTCLRRGDEGRVPLAVLPVDVQVRTLRQRYDDVHVALIARDQQSYLKGQGVTEGRWEGGGWKELRSA